MTDAIVKGRRRKTRSGSDKRSNLEEVMREAVPESGLRLLPLERARLFCLLPIVSTL
ncbi:MAG TPA: hypothetical protein VLA99_07855 [Nitrospiraceae bacterium]|nr:hypothetical protein [Nitrospiraceae bacterium]